MSGRASRPAERKAPLDKPSTDPVPTGPASSPGSRPEGGTAFHAGRAGLFPALMWVLAALVQFVGVPVDTGIGAGMGAGATNRALPADVASLLLSPAVDRGVALSPQEERRSPARPPSRTAGGDVLAPAAGVVAFAPPPLDAPAAPPPARAAAGFLDSRFPTGPPAGA